VSSANRIDRLDISVDLMPEPGLLRPSIEAALAGRALAESSEAAIGRAVRAAATQAAAGGSNQVSAP
jgi:hypothetical protein